MVMIICYLPELSSANEMINISLALGVEYDFHALIKLLIKYPIGFYALG